MALLVGLYSGALGLAGAWQKGGSRPSGAVEAVNCDPGTKLSLCKLGAQVYTCNLPVGEKTQLVSTYLQ